MSGRLYMFEHIEAKPSDALELATDDACDHITVRRGTWADMRAQLLLDAVARAGSIRKAAVVLEVPRSTLTEWINALAEVGP